MVWMLKGWMLKPAQRGRGALPKSIALCAAICLGLAGCGTAYKNAAEDFVRTQPASAWGSAPPSGHQEVEKTYILARLKDPNSADLKYLELRRVVMSASMTDPTVVPVWESRVMVNAKNSFGGYTGAQLWSFLYRNGSLFAIEEPGFGRRYAGQ